MGAAPFGGHSSRSSLSSFSVSFGPETTLFSAREEIWKSEICILVPRHLPRCPQFSLAQRSFMGLIIVNFINNHLGIRNLYSNSHCEINPFKK